MADPKPASASAPVPTTRGRNRRALVLLVVLAALLGLLAYTRGYVPGTSPQRLRLAQQALDRHELDEAAVLLEKCVAADPDDGDLHLLLARTLRRGGRWDAADRHFSQALAYGADAEAAALEGMLRRAQRGEGALLEPALAKRMREGHPDSHLIMEALVLGHLNQLDLKSAHRLANLWVENFPDKWQPLFLRGLAFQRANSAPAAADDYGKVLALNPELVQVRLLRAELLLELNRFQEGLDEFERCRKKLPKAARVRLGAAGCLFGLGRLDPARETLAPLLEKEPIDPNAAFLQGRIALEKSGPAEALPWLKQAEAALPHDPDVLYVLAQALRPGDPKAAVAKEAASKSLREKRIRLTRLRQEFFTAAPPADDKERATDLQRRLEIADLSAALGYPGEAAAWYQGILQADPRHAGARAALEKLLGEKSGPQP